MTALEAQELLLNQYLDAAGVDRSANPVHPVSVRRYLVSVGLPDSRVTFSSGGGYDWICARLHTHGSSQPTRRAYAGPGTSVWGAIVVLASLSHNEPGLASVAAMLLLAGAVEVDP